MTDLVIPLAKYLFLLPIVVFIVYTIFTKDRKHFLTFSFFTSLASFILSVIAGYLFNNPRPFTLSGTAPLVWTGITNGFPSNHTLTAATVAGIFTKYRPRLGTLLWLVAVLVGISRVMAGVHHMIDIVGALAIAVASTGVVHLILKRYQK